MALRNIRVEGDEILRKRSREISEINDRVLTLIQDMKDTMYHAEGVGLAAPQIGILKRIVVIDVGNGPIVLINPEIVNVQGNQIDLEGCLSVPGVQEKVERPQKVTVKALNEKGEMFELEGEGLLARAFCHEIDHLNGTLFIDKTIKESEEE